MEVEMYKLIEKTKLERDVKINHFNNIVDDELAAIVIKEIDAIEEKLNYYYKKAKVEHRRSIA